MKLLLQNRMRSLVRYIHLPLILLGLLWISTPALAQQPTVTGRITSSQDNTSIPGVNVIVKGTSNGTVSDAEGNYIITITDRTATLVFSSIGFDTQEVVIGEQSAINISLKPSATELQELVVVGYGVQEKVSVTNAVSEIGGDDLVRRPVSSLDQSIQGKLPGVTILDRGGQPGSSNTQILIRGVNKPYTPVGLDQNVTSQIGDNGPLVIVDGIEQPYQYINPADVESVTVLKDASSSAIYGSRAANGVILITTKRAKTGKVTVNYSGSMSIQSAISKPVAMDPASYFQLENTAYANVGAAIPASLPQYTTAGMAGYVAGIARSPLKYPLPYDWFNVMYRNAPQVNNTLSVSGGSESFKARLSLRNQNQQGIIANTESKLTEVRLSTDYKVSNKINIGTDIDYRNQINTEPHAINDIFRFMMQNAIWAVPKYPNGVYGGGTQGNSPLLLAENAGVKKTTSDYILGNIRADWEIVKGLKFTTQLGIRSTNTAVKDFTNTWETRDSTTVKKSNTINSVIEQRVFDREYTWNNLMNYDVTIAENHNIKLLAGYSQIYHENSTIYAYREQFYNNDVQSVGQGTQNAANVNSNAGQDFKWGLRSYFGRINYNYKGKYLFEANGRYDGSSRFSSANRYAFFPSFSGGWRISEEGFWSGVRSTVSSLKIRGSWGKTGNQAIPFYNFYPTMSSVVTSFNNLIAQGYEQKGLADPNLTWETTTQTDIGIDGELLNGKIVFAVDYYNKRTSDILLKLNIPGVLGLQSNFQNAGIVDNKGWEFSVGTRNKIGQFTLATSLNFNINKNEVISLAGGAPSIQGNDIDPRYITGEGYPINGFWGYKTAGLYQTDAQAAADPTFMRAAKAGDVRMVDRDGNGVIDPNDMTFLGNSFPTNTFGGTINLSWKNFSLNIALQGTAGSYMRIARALGEQGNFEGFTPDIYTNNYWTPERTDARFPRPTKQDLRNQASTDRMLVDASYLRVKNVQLSYTIPSTLLKKLLIEQANVYFSATNVLTFSKLNEWHLDPESSSGWQNYYPQTAVYTLGVNLQF